MESIEVLYSAPIPTGHRVRVQWFKEPIIEYSFMSETVVGHEEMTEEPVIEDLDTGVIYGPLRLFLRKSDEFTASKINDLQLDPREDHEPSRTLEGRLLSARVLTSQVGEQHQVQTTLTIEQNQRGGAYR